MSESSGGVKNKMQQGAERLGQEAQQTASEVKERGSEKASEQLDRRTNELGRQTKSLAEALRRTGRNMQQQGQSDGVERVTGGVADRLERVGGYLEGARGDNMLRDAERFARQHAWLVAGSAAFAGLLASRFLKASSERRYDSDARAGRTWSPAATTDLYAEADPELSPYGRVEPAIPAGRGV
jgi:hypothetical protein